MTNRTFTSTLILLWLAAQAWAQPTPTQAVILPLETSGSYTPVDDDSLTQTLEARLQQLAPKAQLQVARSADLTAYQYVAASDQPPTLGVADTISRAYGANYVCWISIRFQPSFQADTSTLALAGATRVWIYNGQQHRVEMDTPLALLRTGTVKDVKNAQSSQAEANELSKGCLNDLAVQLVAVAQQKFRQAQQRSASWGPPVAPSFTPSANYTAMMQAVTQYQKATSEQDLMDVTSGEQNMVNLWTTLNQQEQTHLAKTLPGIVQLITAPASYGGGYWPYYYGR